MPNQSHLPAAALPPPRASGTLARPLASLAAVARYGAGVLALAVVYFAAGKASLALQFEGPVAAIWLPSGVGAAALYLAGLRWWPGVLLGDLALADPAQPLGTAFGITAGNMADIVAVATVLGCLVGRRAALERREDVAAVLVAILAGAGITATVAVSSLRAGGVPGSADIATFWRSWFLADASGSLVVVPLVLAWARPPREALRRQDAGEAALILVAVVVLSAVALSAAAPLTYLVFPALIWSALRFGPRGATLAVAVAAGLAVFITAGKVGPVVEHSITDSVLNTQLYVAVAAITTLLLGAIVAERRQTARQLADARNRVVAAADAERRRIERDLHDGAQQRLVALRIRVDLTDDLLHAAPASARRAVAELGVLVDDALTDVRSLATGIYPAELVQFGLAPALHALVGRAPIAAHAHIDDGERCRPEVEAAVYFCCSEAMQNAAKHAGPDTTVVLSLRRRHGLHFEIQDDGPGFVTEQRGRSGGLVNMRERVEAVGGTLRVRSRAGHGTRVIGDIPQP